MRRSRLVAASFLCAIAVSAVPGSVLAAGSMMPRLSGGSSSSSTASSSAVARRVEARSSQPLQSTSAGAEAKSPSAVSRFGGAVKNALTPKSRRGFKETVSADGTVTQTTTTKAANGDRRTVSRTVSPNGTSHDYFHSKSPDGSSASMTKTVDLRGDTTTSMTSTASDGSSRSIAKTEHAGGGATVIHAETDANGDSRNWARTSSSFAPERSIKSETKNGRTETVSVKKYGGGVRSWNVAVTEQGRGFPRASEQTNAAIEQHNTTNQPVLRTHGYNPRTNQTTSDHRWKDNVNEGAAEHDLSKPPTSR